MSRQQLETIADKLEALRTDVRAKMNSAAAEESDKLFLQILEISHRLNMIDQILFKAGTVDLSLHVDSVLAASEQIDEALDRLEGIASAVNGIKSLLGIVDSAIDLIS